MEKKKSINHFETEWSWGNIVTIMADNCGIVQIYFENGYHYGLIEGLKVDPNKRRKGIGTALMEKAEELNRAKGFDELQLKVQKDHTYQFEWYKRLGYKVIIEDDDYYTMRKIF